MLKSTNRGIWNEEYSEKKLRPISPAILKKFGLTMDNVQQVENIEALRDNPPNIVVAEAKKKFRFVQNFFKEQELKKRQKYVMGLGVFQQLHLAGDTKKKLLVVDCDQRDFDRIEAPDGVITPTKAANNKTARRIRNGETKSNNRRGFRSAFLAVSL